MQIIRENTTQIIEPALEISQNLKNKKNTEAKQEERQVISNYPSKLNLKKLNNSSSELISISKELEPKKTKEFTTNIIKIFRQIEDKHFAHDLLNKTIKESNETSNIIYDLAKNWDKDRIALSDLIIMKMAITEMKYFQSIPYKVSLDEYIEISKEYSTPKSKEFVNGILDTIYKNFKEKS